MAEHILGYRRFVDGSMRPIFEAPDGRQYIPGDDGQPVHGVFLDMFEDLADEPLIVRADGE